MRGLAATRRRALAQGSWGEVFAHVPRSGNRRIVRRAMLAPVALPGASPSGAQDFITSLVAIYRGSALSDRTSSLRAGG